MRPSALPTPGRRRVSPGVPVGLIPLLAALFLAGCSDLPVQFGRDDPKKRDMKGRVVKLEGEGAGQESFDRVGDADAAYDAHHEQAASTYRQSYLFWNAEQKQFEDSIGGNRVAFDGAYNRILAHLTRMARFLGVAERERLDLLMNQYRSIHQLVAGGNQGRLVSRQATSVGDKVRAEFAPGLVTLVPLVPAGPEVPDNWTPPEAVAAAGGPASPAGTATAGGAPVTAAANPKAPRTYLGAYADWRAHHKTLVDTLFSESPQIDEPYRNALDALERMRVDLPSTEAERLGLFRGEYERTAKGFLEGVTARKTITQFRLIATEIEKNFAPEAVPFP